MISVFLPCTPNPTTGFYFYVPVKDVVEVAITPNEAAQLVMSAGLIQPTRVRARSNRWPKPRAPRRRPPGRDDLRPHCAAQRQSVSAQD